MSNDRTPPENLPENPDVEVDETSTGLPLPVHVRPAYIALVAVGGALGSFTRYAVGSTLTVNLIGALALGVLLETLSLRGRELGGDVGRQRAVRLFVGTGFLGGFTTYSALALETDRHLEAGDIAIGIGYVAVSVIGGVLAAVLGILATRRIAR